MLFAISRVIPNPAETTEVVPGKGLVQSKVTRDLLPDLFRGDDRFNHRFLTHDDSFTQDAIGALRITEGCRVVTEDKLGVIEGHPSNLTLVIPFAIRV